MKNTIKTIEDVKAFVQYLIDNDQLYHFDDEPNEVINSDNEATFTSNECKLLNKRINEICELYMLDEAFEYALDYLEQD